MRNPEVHLIAMAGWLKIMLSLFKSYVLGLDALRSIFSAGTNLSAPVPKLRWDHAEYFDPDGARGIVDRCDSLFAFNFVGIHLILIHFQTFSNVFKRFLN